MKEKLKQLIIEQYNCQWGVDIVDDLLKLFEEENTEAKQLLKEAVNILNGIPNYTAQEGFKKIDHYKLCSKIDKFLKDES